MSLWIPALLLAAAAGDAKLSAEALKAKIVDLGAAVTSLRVEYRSYSYEGGAVPDGAYFHKRFIAVAPGTYVLESGHGYDDMDWRDDPFRQIAFVSPTEVRDEAVPERSFFRYTIAPEDALPGTLDNEFYFVATGLWPLTGRRAPGGGERAQVLADVAASADFNSVRPATEVVNERECHVLEWPGRDALWLDVERGGALMKREKHDEEGRLSYRYELGGHVEDAPSVWLPRWIVREDFAPETGELERRVRMEILVTDLGPFDREELIPPIAPGAIELSREDPDAPPVQLIEGGLDLIDQQVAWMGRLHPRELSEGSPRRSRWVFALTAAVLLCGLVEVVVRRRG